MRAWTVYSELSPPHIRRGSLFPNSFFFLTTLTALLWLPSNGGGKISALPKTSYLWPTLWFQHLLFSSKGGPALGSLRSSSEPLYSRHWPCHKPGSSELRRHCGEPRSSCGPAGRPAAGCRLVCGSTTQKSDHCIGFAVVKAFSRQERTVFFLVTIKFWACWKALCNIKKKVGDHSNCWRTALPPFGIRAHTLANLVRSLRYGLKGPKMSHHLVTCFF